MKKWNYEECENEVAYIKGINPVYPGSNFCFNKSSFITYVEMIQKHIIKSGFPLAAADLRGSIDIAKCAILNGEIK